MNWHFYSLMATSLACLTAVAGCGGGDDYPGTGGAGGGAGGGPGPGGGAGEGGGGGGGATSPFIRIHYRLQGGSTDVTMWGAHFWGAGSASPMWGSPQLFGKTDDFGAYTDVAVTVTEDKPDAWLGLIPVQCAQGNCKKDVETAVRFVDLEKNPATPNIGECWITQGQAIQIKKPTSTGPAYKVSRAKDFIDLGNGSVRLMFRVAKGSTGTVQYGTAAAALDQLVTWAATDDINANGLVLSSLTPGAKIYYKISSNLKTPDNQDLKDESPVLDLTPIQFATISDASDWAAWGSKGIMYQIIVRTFADGGAPKAVGDTALESGIDTATKDGIGDLVGLKDTLHYLKDLGIDAIWMTPSFKAKSYHGYDTTDFYDIDPAVGTKKDFADLTTSAHNLGIKIILDLVQNHVADVNPWFSAALDSKDGNYPKYHDWFVWSDEYSNMLTDKHPWDPSAVVWACKNYMCYHEIFGASMPELNYHNPEVRAEMKKISEFWIKLGADGFRLDASKHIDQFDDNNNVALDKHGTHVWWKEFNHYVKKGVTRPAGSLPVLLAGENRWDDPAVYPYMVPYGSDMDSQFDFPFRSFISNLAAGKTGDEVDFVKYLKALQQAAAATANGGNPNHYFERFLSNHDLDRPATQFEGAPAPLSALLKQVATIVFTVPGMPVIYYGEEFGKKGKRDKFVGDESWDHDEFIREPMSWFKSVSLAGDKTTSWNIDFVKTNSDNQSLSLGAGICKAANPDYPFIKFMTEDDLNSWAAQKDDPSSLFSYYRKLIEIRKANPVITDLNTQLTTVKNTADVYEFTLAQAGQSLTVVLNRKPLAQTIVRAAAVKDLITGTQASSFNVPPYGALILQ
jgi:glycosidase